MSEIVQTMTLPDVIPYWFGNLRADRPFSYESAEFRRWYGKDPKIDTELRTAFGALHQSITAEGSALAGEATGEEMLARIIVIDQMSRNMFRDTARMYACDDLGLALSRSLVETEAYRGLDLFRQMFAALPFMHSERLADQERMIIEFDRFSRDAKDLPTADFFADALRFARRHLEIVARFGRFPHRNAILGRTSTPEETAFLLEADSSF